MSEDFDARFKSYIDAVNTALDGYLTQKNNAQSTVYTAMRYSVSSGGKRIRPVLMMSTCEMCGGNAKDALPFACAIEMIHTYSLIHDDLPAMDNSPLRRGKPSSHIKFGEANAILAGDALLTKAFEAASSSPINPERALRAISIIADAAGTEGMVGGQVIDIEGEDKRLTLGEITNLDLLKTGALIKASCAVGAVIAGADESDVKRVSEYAENLGIAFQIRDDILDVTAGAEEIGKPSGSDERENKSTYVKLLGLEGAEGAAREYSVKAKDALAPFGDKAWFLNELTDRLLNRRK